MSRTLTASLILVLTVSGCGTVRDSRLNPVNWFGRDRSEPVQAVPAEEVNPLIPQERRGLFARAREERAIYQGQPVDVIKDLQIERVPGGAIVRATGVSRFQNTYDVQLTPVFEDGPQDGLLEYRLEAIVPERPIPGGSERQREVIAAVSLTDQQLEEVRQIRVAGSQNARVSARR